MKCLCILLASFLNLLTNLQKPTAREHTYASANASLIVLCTSRGSYRPCAQVIRASNSSAAPGAAAVSVMGWNRLRLSPGETKETDRDVAGLKEGADCDP